MDTQDVGTKVKRKDACTKCRKSKQKCEREDEGPCKYCRKRRLECVVEPVKHTQVPSGLPTSKPQGSKNFEESEIVGARKQRKSQKQQESFNATASHDSDPDHLFIRDPFEASEPKMKTQGASGKPSIRREVTPQSAGPSSFEEDYPPITHFRISIQSREVGGYTVLSPDILLLDSETFLTMILDVWGFDAQQVEKLHVKITWNKNGSVIREIETIFETPENFLKVKRTINWILGNRQNTAEEEVLVHVYIFPKQGALRIDSTPQT